MIIQTEYGAVEGIRRNGCDVYLGIPFAHAPVGEFSFRHPVPPELWNTVLQADHGRANPIQARGGFYTGNNSTDCLYMNIFVPQHAEGKLPVMVWIYGGSYAQGGTGALTEGSEEVQYDLSRFAEETACIAVSFNYRLNAYGFLHFHDLNRNFDANNGLYDQIAALGFVKRNISSFGGDPDNITVFGQSAGGACILALMTMHEAEGLFQKAIVQSACIEHFFTAGQARKNTHVWMKYAGIGSPEEIFRLNEAEICRANERYSSWLLRKGDIRCAFSPVIDGITLKEDVKQAVTASEVKLLIGSVSEEANLFLSAIPSFLLPAITKHIGLSVPRGKGSCKKRACDALTDHIYARPMKEILQEYRGQAWRYEYRHVLPGSKTGCFHASELPVLFDMNMMGYSPDESSGKTGKHMRRIWGRFAYEGKPGWEEYRTGQETYIIE
ncbi:MAG: carboxylesterase family protein [Erysipelotrichaceae bacterium]|nr:carboxylesterase family protein [Erysipelotrichaceae bacterium]